MPANNPSNFAKQVLSGAGTGSHDDVLVFEHFHMPSNQSSIRIGSDAPPVGPRLRALTPAMADTNVPVHPLKPPNVAKRRDSQEAPSLYPGVTSSVQRTGAQGRRGF